jgi:hypothetical protein
MKKLIIGLLGIVLCASSFAQTVTVQFRGNQSQNYRIMIDGTRFRSADAVNTTNDVYNSSTDINRGVRRTLTVNNLMPGSHKLEVYSVTGNNYDRRGQLVYTNNFQLRPDYNMFITINGQRITFSERSNPLVNANGRYRTSMPAGNFSVLLNNIRNSRYEDSRATAIRSALGSTDYFTIDQISQMLSLVNSESTRLELAKTAYMVSADPANYRQLYPLFTNTYYSNGLDEYVRLQANNNGIINGGVTTTGRTLLTSYAYNRLLQDLNANNYQSGKYEIIRNAFANNGYAFTTEQVRQLLGSINSEPDRLYLAKQSYVTISDPANFSTLLTLFGSQSNRADLNAYIINNGGVGSNVNVYTRVGMSDARFSELYRHASNHILPGDKYTDVRALFSDPQNYFTTAQARQLMSLVSSGSFFSTSEANRVELAKLAYSRVVDTQNFTEIVNLFDRQSSRDELNGYIRMQANY